MNTPEKEEELRGFYKRLEDPSVRSLVQEQLYAHRSCRHFDTSKEVTTAEIQNIVETAQRTSSYGNLQTYSIITVRNKENINRLSAIHDNPAIATCAVLFVFCSDTHRARQWLRMRNAPDSFDDFLGFLVGTVDCCIAAQSTMLAAESRGLACCYLGTTLWKSRQIGEALGTPPGVVPITSIMMGWPAAAHFQMGPRARLSVHAIWHQEKYNTLTDEELSDSYLGMEKTGEDRYRANPKVDALFKEKEIGNIAQYYSIHKYPKSLHLQVSEMLTSYLKDSNLL